MLYTFVDLLWKPGTKSTPSSLRKNQNLSVQPYLLSRQYLDHPRNIPTHPSTTYLFYFLVFGYFSRLYCFSRWNVQINLYPPYEDIFQSTCFSDLLSSIIISIYTFYCRRDQLLVFVHMLLNVVPFTFDTDIWFVLTGSTYIIPRLLRSVFSRIH